MKNQASEICGEVKKIYDWLDSQLADAADKCTACGNCCDFARFGHRLFVTTPELLYFKNNIKNFLPMRTGVCPYMKNNKCTAREFRFASCRIFFCKADEEFQEQLATGVGVSLATFQEYLDKVDFSGVKALKE